MWLEWVAAFKANTGMGGEKHSASRVRTPLTPPAAHGNMKISCGFLYSFHRPVLISKPFIVAGAAAVVVVVIGCIRASIGFYREIGLSVFILCSCVHMCVRAASYFYK